MEKNNDVFDVYRQIDNFLKLNESGCLIVGIDGRSGAGKTSLSIELLNKYDCNVFHIDDFFLRPQQRTNERLSVPGENIDHERFFNEVLFPLSEGKSVTFQRYNCHTQQLENPETVPYKRINVVEGVYSFHPSLVRYYSLKIFMDVDSAVQKERITERNPKMASKFFDTWIPLEEKYFKQLDVMDKADLVVKLPIVSTCR